MWQFTSSIPVVHKHHENPYVPTTTTYGGDGSSEEPGKTSDAGAEEDNSSSILHCAIAGGLGGGIGDTAMHSLDTVKTRQQGAPRSGKYRSMLSAYRTIFVEEGVRRGLYGGYCAAMLGSLPSAALFFSTYEYSKKKMIDDWQINETTTHLTAGFLGDLVSSIVYVPSEVLKTRLQLQGRYNNPHFDSGYNYRNLRDTIKTIIKTEGVGALLFGYKATLARDLPFSALQFAFYEKFRQWSFKVEGKDFGSDDLSLASEIYTGACAGGLAGIITTPLDVIKTRVQTQQPSNGVVKSHTKPLKLSGSLFVSLKTVYQSEGIVGFFSGVGPRFVWTSVQSSIMLLLYQMSLRALNNSSPKLLK